MSNRDMVNFQNLPTENWGFILPLCIDKLSKCSNFLSADWILGRIQELYFFDYLKIKQGFIEFAIGSSQTF